MNKFLATVMAALLLGSVGVTLSAQGGIVIHREPEVKKKQKVEKKIIVLQQKDGKHRVIDLDGTVDEGNRVIDLGNGKQAIIHIETDDQPGLPKGEIRRRIERELKARAHPRTRRLRPHRHDEDDHDAEEEELRFTIRLDGHELGRMREMRGLIEQLIGNMEFEVDGGEIEIDLDGMAIAPMIQSLIEMHGDHDEHDRPGRRPALTRHAFRLPFEHDGKRRHITIRPRRRHGARHFEVRTETPPAPPQARRQIRRRLSVDRDDHDHGHDQGRITWQDGGALPGFHFKSGEEAPPARGAGDIERLEKRLDELLDEMKQLRRELRAIRRKI